jgi:hypothetical protein
LHVRATLDAQTAVTLKQLVAQEIAVSDEFFKQDWVLQPQQRAKDPRLQALIVDGHRMVVFVEYKPFQLQRRANSPSEAVKVRVARLAKPLSIPAAAQSGFCVLQCIGILQQDLPSTRFAFVFKLPNAITISNAETTTSAMLPISLSDAIVSDDYVRPTLNAKFKLAASLVRTVTQFHSINWLHKSIRGENVLLFPLISNSNSPETSEQLEYSHPYLAGFEFSRLAGDRSTTETDDILSRNLYRSPSRWGAPEESFSVLDDIYALGVTLLEIGIWRPLIKFQANFADKSPDEVKACLIEHATYRVPHYMGVEYTHAVLKCLKGDFGPLPERRTLDPDSVELNLLMQNEVAARIEMGVPQLSSN